MTIVEFLRAQLDEDERIAQAATRYWHGVSVESATNAEEDHVRRHDPARVLREVEAKRRIVAWCAEVIGDRDLSGYDRFGSLAEDLNAMAVTLAVETLRNLTSPYADHPDYDPSWGPS